MNAALTVFERKAERSGYSPKIDEAESFTMDPDSDGQSGALKLANPTSPFQKVGFKPGQTPDYSAYGYEMIFIPTIAIPNVQWQGL